MSNSSHDAARTTKNYVAHGGNELVIGGKLTFLSTAVVEDPCGILGGKGCSAVAIHQKQSEATTVAALREDFNQLLTVLIAAGVIAAADEEAE